MFGRETSNEARLEELGALLHEVRDVIETRVTGPTPPAFAETRGWTDYLLSIDDEALSACERGQLARRLADDPRVPGSLRELAARAIVLTSVPRLHATRVAPDVRRASARKRAQISALAEAIEAWGPRIARVVDLGAGHGHLTRSLAEALDLEALGVERDAARVRTAERLTRDPRVGFEARSFEASEVGASGVESSVPDVAADDLLVGLHACGDLGDALVRAAAASGAGVVLVACCAQKIRAPSRLPLSRRGQAMGLALERGTLGLTNLAGTIDGAIDSQDVMTRRQTRYALHLALREAGVPLALGDEMHGINRRRARGPLSELAATAFRARGLAVPARSDLEAIEARAAREHAQLRRLTLPRSLLARSVEVALAFDRAVALDEAGQGATVVEVFDRAHSPRNVGVLREPSARAS